jgi:hypothetical protein
MELTAEQRQTIAELQEEIRILDLKADIEWAKYIHTKDEDCWDEVRALESEAEFKGTIAYIPKAGELKVSKIRNLISRVKGRTHGPNIGTWQARLDTLEGINEWRETYGLPALERLPRGVPGDQHECTIAKALRMSMDELKAQEVSVSVAGGGEISVSGVLSDGKVIDDRPNLGAAGNDVISDFDEKAWLDLLTDGALQYYASGCLEEGDSGRLQEISDEMKERGMRHQLGRIVTLGVDAAPVEEQFSDAGYDPFDG